MNAGEHEEFLHPSALHRGLSPHADRASARSLAPLVARLCRFYRTLKQAQAAQAEVYQPAGEWQGFIDEMQPVYKPLLDGDVPAATRLLREFWRNELGVIVKQYATFGRLQADAGSRALFAERMAHDYMVWRNLVTAPARDLAVPRVGHPWGYYVDGVLVAPKALRYHLLAHQIRDVLSDVRHPVVAEIGAGYGGTAYYLLRDQAPITYIDFDLPEILVLAAYYLLRSVPHRRVLLYESGMTLTRATIRRHSVLLLPNWMIGALPARSVDLFLNTFSLSEMPRPVIAMYMRHITRTCRGYFLHNNMDRSGVVHRGYERVPCSEYPLSPRAFKMLYKRYDLFQRRHSGRDGDYREVLLERCR